MAVSVILEKCGPIRMDVFTRLGLAAPQLLLNAPYLATNLIAKRFVRDIVQMLSSLLTLLAS